MVAKNSAMRRRTDPAEDAHTPMGSVGDQQPKADAIELNRLIHERVRLGIVSALAVNGSLPFTDLRDLLGITDGNLSAHARRLEGAGYVACTKSYDGRTSKTEYALTAVGRDALEAYLDHMEAIIQITRHESSR